MLYTMAAIINTKNIMLFILTAWLYFMIYHIAVNKKESDRQEALTMSRNAVLNFDDPYAQVTSQNNPITTGIFSIIISLPFNDIRHLTFIFWLSLIAVFYNGIHFINYGLFLMLFLPVSRTLYYQLSEIYFIILAVYFTKKYWLLLLWRNPFAFIRLTNKNINLLAAVLDYCLLPVLPIMLYYNNKSYLK